MMQRKALLIDYEYCIGCCQCEIACITAHDADVNSLGIKVSKLGPWKGPDGKLQYDFIPIPTDWCDMCEGLVENDGRVACQKACTHAAHSIQQIWRDYSRAEDGTDSLSNQSHL